MTQKETIAELKKKFLAYYRDLPVQKYAAMSVGRDEDTILLWRKQDSDFSDKMIQARAEWVREQSRKSPAPWKLERLEREAFAPPKQEVEITNPTVDILKGFGIEPTGEAPPAKGETS